jgi:hypothetical protein
MRMAEAWNGEYAVGLRHGLDEARDMVEDWARRNGIEVRQRETLTELLRDLAHAIGEIRENGKGR